MRVLTIALFIIILLQAGGCTTSPRKEEVIIHCPACGTELDAIIQKRF